MTTRGGEPVTVAPLDLIAKRVVVNPIAATYPLTAFREAVAHVQRGGKVMFDVEEAI